MGWADRSSPANSVSPAAAMATASNEVRTETPRPVRCLSYKPAAAAANSEIPVKQSIADGRNQVGDPAGESSRAQPETANAVGSKPPKSAQGPVVP